VLSLPVASGDDEPRVIVLTDVTSLTAGVREPDDGQSLIRLMLYTNELDIEGLVASSGLGHGHVVRPELIRKVVAAYAAVRPNLLLHSAGYPPAEELLARIRSGQPVAGPDVPVTESVGEGKDTPASDWIIQVVDRPDPRPVWVLAWGGTADLAQALWRVRATRGAAELARFVAKLRVDASYDQDATGAWIREQFPELRYIRRDHGIRGMYRGGDTSLVSPAWIQRNLHDGHGPLGALYPIYRGGDLWTRRFGPKPLRGIKEGDTPTFLRLIPNGLNVPSAPEWGGWGGRFTRLPGGSAAQYTDAQDAFGGFRTDLDPRMAALYRWRPAFQNDFAARMAWSVLPRSEANHHPRPMVDGDTSRTVLRLPVRAGARVTLDASRSRDPDGDALAYAWYVYPEPSTYRGVVRVDESNAPVARVEVPADAAGHAIHVILEVTDRGDPPLTAYRRVVLEVR